MEAVCGRIYGVKPNRAHRGALRGKLANRSRGVKSEVEVQFVWYKKLQQVLRVIGVIQRKTTSLHMVQGRYVWSIG